MTIDTAATIYRMLFPPTPPAKAKTPGEVAFEASRVSGTPEWDSCKIRPHWAMWEKIAAAVIEQERERVRKETHGQCPDCGRGFGFMVNGVCPCRLPSPLPTEEDVRSAGWSIILHAAHLTIVYRNEPFRVLLTDGSISDVRWHRDCYFPTRESALAAWARRKER